MAGAPDRAFTTRSRAVSAGGKLALLGSPEQAASSNARPNTAEDEFVISLETRPHEQPSQMGRP
jgi:hypothetical protein